MHSRRPIASGPSAVGQAVTCRSLLYSRVAAVDEVASTGRVRVGGDRCASQCHALGSLGAARGEAQRPKRCPSTRARSPRRVWLPGTSSTMRRDRCGAGARDGCQPRCCAHLMGRSGQSPPPNRRRASRAAGRAPKEGLSDKQNRPSVSGANSASPRSTSARGPKSSPAA